MQFQGVHLCLGVIIFHNLSVCCILIVFIKAVAYKIYFSFFITANIAMLSGKEKSNEESSIQRIRNSSLRENTVYKNQDGITIPEMQRSHCKSRTTLNEGTEDELVITGYRFNLYKSIFIGFLFVITAGLLWLFLYWMPKVRIRFTHDEVDLEMADTVLVEV